MLRHAGLQKIIGKQTSRFFRTADSGYSHRLPKRYAKHIVWGNCCTGKPKPDEASVLLKAHGLSLIHIYNFYTDFDVYLTDIDYITLVNKGSDAWYPDWIEITNDYELPNPETGEECYYHFKVDSFIDTKNYEYRFTHDGKRNAPATVGSTQPISDEELIAMLEKAGAPSTLQTTVDDGHTVPAQVLARCV